ncbi:ribonucleoprotein PTB-binding 2 isoform X2 [Rhinatrema bivittatum]|uniref:ribonucleoprotein PTB-binding 2 isoform X2 n=1 Tax=Rhinatrema bivittatum TaxID=194408 RepID=UPI00112B0B13|nr:ribonucleoprotein PTB-binding 2 isoform X2 [Rhinatrema bivittatum]
MAAHSAALCFGGFQEAFLGEDEDFPSQPESPAEQQPPPPGVEEEVLSGQGKLDAEEIACRLEKTRRELSNRRKILIRNLPQDSSSQEVHDLLKDYELKYCYVDKNKRTAFVTLRDGEQAQDAIQKFHQYSLREKEITIQLQPTDALLCITNLAPSFTLEEFEELVRAYGNTERCFLVYNEVTGHSKGYGFVEYMKKDSAAKARLELLGRPLGEFTLFAQWMDVNLLTADLIHSKCLCVDKIPKEYCDYEELLQAFSSLHTPVFCQFAQDEGSYFGGFAVIEYDTAEQAEAVKDTSDGLMLRGSPVRISFCAPGASGRSTLAALIAAQGMMQNSKKGLLPEPNAVQILKSFSNPAMLQMMLQPQLRGSGGKPVLAASPGLPHFLNPALNPAFLPVNKVQQKLDLGNTCNILLQNISQLHMAQQQLLKIKSTQTNSKPGLLGEAPATLLQKALGLGPAPPVNAEMSHRAEAQKATNLTSASKAAAGVDMMPFFPSQSVPGLSQDKPSSTAAEEAVPGSQTYLQSFTNFPAGAFPVPQPPSQPKSINMSSGALPSNQTSLLGEPPRDFRLSTNPYLNLASVLPGVCLPGPPKAAYAQQQTGVLGSTLETAVSQGSSSQPALENYFNYCQQYGDYTQEAVQQWYAHYNQVYSTTQAGKQEDGGSEKIGLAEIYQHLPTDDYYNQGSAAAYGNYNTYLHVMPSYYTGAQGAQQPASAQSSQQNPLNKTPWRTEKRGSSYLLPSPETNAVDHGSQNSQDAGEHYTDSSFKRKRVY